MLVLLPFSRKRLSCHLGRRTGGGLEGMSLAGVQLYFAVWEYNALGCGNVI